MNLSDPKMGPNLGSKFTETSGNGAVGRRQIHCPPFCLDLTVLCLRRGTEVVPLRPKTLAVLQHLALHAGQVVAKNDLLANVWRHTKVSSGVPAVCIRELRQA